MKIINKEISQFRTFEINESYFHKKFKKVVAWDGCYPFKFEYFGDEPGTRLTEKEVALRICDDLNIPRKYCKGLDVRLGRLYNEVDETYSACISSLNLKISIGADLENILER